MTGIFTSFRPPQLAIILLIFIVMAPCARVRAEFSFSGSSENAALYYWKAAALIPSPGTRDELELANLADLSLVDVSPAIFAAQPDLLRWLLRNASIVSALHQARSCAICAFSIRTRGEPFLDLSHLPRMRALTRRALAIAKAYEFVDNAPGAAEIYVDLLKLVQHLDQDRNLISGFVAAELLQRILSELESFFGRSPSAEAVAPLVEYFKGAPSPIFHAGAYLRDEARRYGDWLLADPAHPEERLSRLYRNVKSKPAVEKLITLDAQKKQQRLKSWVEDYRRQMPALAAAVELPFASGLPRIRQLDKEKEALQENASSPGENPLVPLLVPTTAEMYQRFLLAEAQFDMLDILCLAAAFRAETGSWPEDIAAISRHTRRALPKDPFSNEPFYYKVIHGNPILITRVPKWMTAKAEYIYLLDIGQRMKDDQESTMGAAKQIGDDQIREMNEPVPME